MLDPSPVPWVCVWIGFVIAVAGAIAAMSGWGQRETRRMDVLGKWAVGCGVSLMLSTVLINGAVIGVHLMSDIIKTVIASSQPTPELQAPTR